MLHPAQRFSWCTLHIHLISRVTVLIYSFSYLDPVCCSMSSSNCCFLTCIQISQEAGKVVWYSHIFKSFPQFVVIHIVEGIGVVNKAEIGVFFWNSLAFLMIQQMLEIWSLVPLPFLNPSWISGSSWFTYCWSLAWSFEHYFASMWDECNCVVVWTFFGICLSLGLK